MNLAISVELLKLHLQYKGDNIMHSNFVVIIMSFINFKD